MSASPRAADSGFRHRAICYRTEDELVDTLVPLLSAAVEAGEAVFAVLDPSSRRAVRDRLGPAAGEVNFADPVEVYGYSGQTTAATRAEQLRGLTAGGRRATVVGQHSASFDGPGGAYWCEVDAALNVALADLPVTVLCPYPITVVSERIAMAVRWNHAELLLDGDLQPNPALRAPADVLGDVPPPPAPRLGPAAEEVRFDESGLRRVRAAAERHGGSVGLDVERVRSLVLAVSELASNSIEHGAGYGTVRWWVSSDRVVAEVHDPGTLDDALPGMRPPELTGARGRGVWLARQLCDVVHMWTSADGTRVRVETAR